MSQSPRAVSASQERVRAALLARGLETVAVREFADRTATAIDAAAAIGTTVERIVKSLLFMADQEPVLVLASGPNRVDLHKVGQLIGRTIRRADAERVREFTGFAIGGVPPVGHTRTLPTLIDRTLLDYDEVWAAAGTPNSVFAITPDELVRVTSGRVADIAQTS